MPSGTIPGSSKHGRDGRRTAVSLAFLAFGAISGSWVPRLPAFKEHLHLTNGQIGFALLVYAVGAIAGAGIARLVMGRGSRVWVRALTVVLCGALVPAGLAANLTQLVVAFLLLGACAGCIDVLENAQAAELERAAGRPLINGFHGFWSLGALIGSVAAGGAAYAGVPPLQQFVVVAVVMAAATAPWLRHLPDTRGGAAPARASSTRGLLTRSAGIVAVFGFCSIVVEGGGGDWSALYLREYGHANPGLAAVGFAGFTVAMTAVRFQADRLTARTSAALVAQLGGLVAAVGLGVAIAVPAVAGATAGFVLIGAGVAVMVPLAFQRRRQPRPQWHCAELGDGRGLRRLGCWSSVDRQLRGQGGVAGGLERPAGGGADRRDPRRQPAHRDYRSGCADGRRILG